MPPNQATINSITPENPKWGDKVTINYTFPDKMNGLPQVYLKADQNGELVLSGGGYDRDMPLPSGEQWWYLGQTMLNDMSQPADGYAQLVIGKRIVAEQHFPITSA